MENTIMELFELVNFRRIRKKAKNTNLRRIPEKNTTTKGMYLE